MSASIDLFLNLLIEYVLFVSIHLIQYSDCIGSFSA